MRVWRESRVASPLTAALGDPAFAAEDIDVEARPSGERIEVRARAASTVLVWRVISDRGRRPEFAPGIAKSTVLERDGIEEQFGAMVREIERRAANAGESL